MKLSVILCTFNRADILPGALHAIYRAAGRPRDRGTAIELIVVDNASNDATAQVLASVMRDAPIFAMAVYQPRPGLSNARNLGMATASGDVLIFSDDDCRIEPSYFDDLIKHHERLTGPAMIGGRIELGDPTDLPFTIKTSDQPATYRGIIHPGGFIHGCNLTMNRAAVELCGDFDIRFGAGAMFKSAEDTDYIYRAYRAGVTVRYVPDMITRHFHGRKALNDVRELNRQYHFGNGALHAKFGVGDSTLTKNLFWNTRNWLKESFGGDVFDEVLGISHADLVGPHLRGAMAYLRHQWATASSFSRPGRATAPSP